MELKDLIAKRLEHRSIRFNAETNLANHTEIAIKLGTTIADIDVSSALINEALKMTQDQIKEQIEVLVTSAMDMVFDRHYEFKLKFSRSGNRLDCKPVLIDDGREMDDPEFDVGGSRVDTVSIALRVVIWSLDSQHLRGTFVLDEPFTALGSSVLLDRTLEMIQRVSKDLDIQIILLTHIDRAKAIADRAWHVTKVNGQSVIECTYGAPEPTGRIRA